MAQDRSARRERLLALATFGGIALATAMALDFLVMGGFEIVPQRQHSPYVDPFAFASVSDASATEWTPSGTTTEVAWTDPTVIEDATEVASNEDLAGDRSVQLATYEAAPSEDDLYHAIAALYEAQDARAADRAEANRTEAAYVEEPYRDAEPAYEEDASAFAEESITKPDPTAYESESPW